jgi:hypothetical protein
MLTALVETCTSPTTAADKRLYSIRLRENSSSRTLSDRVRRRLSEASSEAREDP